MSVSYKDESPEILYNFIAFLKIEKGFPESTIYTYFIELRLFLRYMICNKNNIELDKLQSVDIKLVNNKFIKEIDKQDVVSYLAWQTLEKNIKPRTRNRKIACLKSYFDYLIEAGYLDVNIMIRISSVKTDKNLPKYLHEENIRDLLLAINGKFWKRDTVIISLMIFTGLRVSEVISLNLDSLKNEVITIVGKGNKERQVYLTQHIMKNLIEYLEERPEVETNALFLSERKQRISKRAVQVLTSKYLNSIGLNGYSCHKLRHTAATQLLKAGTNLRVIQEVLGHASISITEIYTHVNSDDVKQAFVMLENSHKSNELFEDI